MNKEGEDGLLRSARNDESGVIARSVTRRSNPCAVRVPMDEEGEDGLLRSARNDAFGVIALFVIARREPTKQSILRSIPVDGKVKIDCFAPLAMTVFEIIAPLAMTAGGKAAYHPTGNRAP